MALTAHALTPGEGFLEAAAARLLSAA
ncbi:MAG: hypothetical protein QG638_2163, partial [Pseudomonadota bacterium]|nr:hypothetical protein [Pseudomonadota bacterium]